MKLWWSLITVTVALLVMIAATNGESNLWEEDDKEVLVRTVRGTKDRGNKFLQILSHHFQLFN